MSQSSAEHSIRTIILSEEAMEQEDYIAYWAGDRLKPPISQTFSDLSNARTNENMISLKLIQAFCRLGRISAQGYPIECGCGQQSASLHCFETFLLETDIEL